MTYSVRPRYLIDQLQTWKLLLFVVAMTFAFGLVYYQISIHSSINGLSETNHSKITFWNAVYFSVVTETTLGYGDITPVGWSRVLVCLQVCMGLLIAGLIVARITAAQAKKMRLIAQQANGYWIEPFKIGNDVHLSFSHIYYDGENLRYDGDNYDRQGLYEGRFKSELKSVEGNVLSFDYFNLERTHLFEGGNQEVTFEGENHSVWTRHSAKCYDYKKEETTLYVGFKASPAEIKIFNGSKFKPKHDLILKYIEDYEATLEINKNDEIPENTSRSTVT